MKIKGCKLFTLVNGIFFALSLVILFAAVKNEGFAGWYSNTVSAFLRYVLSVVTGILPFSLAEMLVVIGLPIILVYTLVKLVRWVFFKRKNAARALLYVFNAVVLCFSLFVNTFGVCYNTASLEKRMGLQREKINKFQLELLAKQFSVALEKDVKNVRFDEETGASVMPYSWDELNSKLDKGYEKLRADYDFLSYCNADAKKILFSPIMTYTHISGIYMPLTGEANVNTNYPKYVVAYSTAHEKAHQRGVASEDEANFVAYLACIASEDDYLVYCAHMSMYDYMLSALYSSDEELYRKLIEESPKEVFGEMYAYSVFFDKYRDSKASEVADNVNDTYLKTLGQEEGIQSYGLVVELMAAYAKKYGI